MAVGSTSAQKASTDPAISTTLATGVGVENGVWLEGMLAVLPADSTGLEDVVLAAQPTNSAAHEIAAHAEISVRLPRRPRALCPPALRPSISRPGSTADLPDETLYVV